MLVTANAAAEDCHSAAGLYILLAGRQPVAPADNHAGFNSSFAGRTCRGLVFS